MRVRDSDGSARSRRQSSKPSTSGIMISATTQSGAQAVMRASASDDTRHERTSCPSLSSIATMTFRASASSSTTKNLRRSGISSTPSDHRVYHRGARLAKGPVWGMWPGPATTPPADGQADELARHHHRRGARRECAPRPGMPLLSSCHSSFNAAITLACLRTRRAWLEHLWRFCSCALLSRGITAARPAAPLL